MAILHQSHTPEHTDAARHSSRMIHYIGDYHLLRLPRKDQQVEVLGGSAWITMDGTDIILNEGDQFVLTEGHDFALVSSAKKNLLVLAVSA